MKNNEIVEVEDLKFMIKDYMKGYMRDRFELNIKNWFEDKRELEVDEG